MEAEELPHTREGDDWRRVDDNELKGMLSEMDGSEISNVTASNSLCHEEQED